MQQKSSATTLAAPVEAQSRICQANGCSEPAEPGSVLCSRHNRTIAQVVPPPLAAPVPAPAEPVFTLTLVGAEEGYTCAKTLRVLPDGKLDVQPYRAGWRFQFWQVNTTLPELERELAVLNQRIHFVHGTPRVAQGPRTYLGPTASLFDAPIRWVAIDIDKLDLPPDMHPLDVRTQALHVRALLPEPFRTAACVAAASSSAGLGTGKIKLRMFFVLDVPLHVATIKQWLKAENAPVDPQLYIPNQPIYAAPPVYEQGAVDPFVAMGAPRPRVCRLDGGTVAVPSEHRGYYDTLESVIEARLRRIRDTADEPDQNRSMILYGIAKDIGKLAPHHVSQEQAVARVFREVSDRWPRYLAARHDTQRTIENGVRDGMREPVYLRLRRVTFVENMASHIELSEALRADTHDCLRYLPGRKSWLVRDHLEVWSELPHNAAPLDVLGDWFSQRADAAEAQIRKTELETSTADEEIARVRKAWTGLGSAQQTDALLRQLRQQPGVSLEVELHAGRSVIDVDDICAKLPLWAMREDIPSQYSADFDAYLHNLHGDSYEYAMDWIACLPYTDQSVPALYLYGVKGAGKSLFAAICAQLFTRSGTIARAEKVLRNFNGSIVDTPIVFGDEGIPRQNHQPMTTKLREIVETRDHSIERKGYEVMHAYGCVRMIIAENEAGASLRAEGHYGEHDIGAIADRIIACEAVKPINNPELAKRFAAGEGAAHLMHIISTRQVTAGDRMMCRSHAGDLVRDAATHSGLSGRLYLHVYRALRVPQHGGTAAVPGVLVRDGQVWLNSTAIAAQAGSYGAFDRTPTPAAVAGAMRLICVGERRHFRIGASFAYYRALDMDAFRRWAKASDMDGPDLDDALQTAAARTN